MTSNVNLWKKKFYKEMTFKIFYRKEETMYDSKNYLSVYKRDHKKWFRFIWKLKVLFFFI